MSSELNEVAPKTKRRSPPSTKKKSSQKSALPVVADEHVLEATSRRLFEEAIAPWLMTDSRPHDYGIDVFVEIARRAHDDGPRQATGKRFAVQLKSSGQDLKAVSVPVPIRTTTLRYWLASTEPVLLVYCHVPSRQLIWRMIDQELMDELNRRDPGWIGQDSVTIHVAVERTLSAEALLDIERWVVAHTRSTSMLEPGTYFRMLDQARTEAAHLLRIADYCGFQSVAGRLKAAGEALRRATFTVAFAGPARAGKSTLLNALVGKAVSPVGRLPTTAVPVMVVAGAEDKIEVIYLDDRRETWPLDGAKLALFATQEQNEDNHRRVRLVTVYLVNTLLESGISLVDAPGLHDPSPEIRLVTEQAFNAASAVVYVLDASPARNGGFSFSDQTVSDLQRLRGVADRLIVVLNKCDDLEAEELDLVFTYAERQLRKYRLLESLPVPPLLIAGRKGWEWRIKGDVGEPSPLQQLEDALWKHLLSTDRTGIVRLRKTIAESQAATRDFAALLSAKVLSSSKSAELRSQCKACRNREDELVGEVRRRLQDARSDLQHQLHDAQARMLTSLQRGLDQIPLSQKLPTGDQLGEELNSTLWAVAWHTWQGFTRRFSRDGEQVSQQVEELLSRVRLAAADPGDARIMVSAPAKFAATNQAAEPEGWIGMLTGLAFGALVGGPWPVVLGFGGWLLGLLQGREAQRRREINKIMAEAVSHIERARRHYAAQLETKAVEAYRQLERQTQDRITIFLNEMERQIADHGEPLDPEVASRLPAYHEHARAAVGRLQALLDELPA